MEANIMVGAARAYMAKKGRRSNVPRAAIGVLAAVCSWSCTEEAEVPEGPDLSSLAAEYDAPTAAIGQDVDIREIVQRYPELQRLAEAFRTTQALLGRGDEGRSAAQARASDGIQLRGGIDISVACPGLPSAGGASPGRLNMELGVARNAIRRTFWTRAENCQFEAGIPGATFDTELDGDLALDLGNDVPLRGSWPRSWLMLELLGTVTIAGVSFSGLSARIQDGTFEYLQPLPMGSVVLFVTDSGVGLRDASSTWYCGTDQAACAIE